MNKHFLKKTILEKDLVDVYIRQKSNINSNIKLIKEIGYRQKKIDLIEFNMLSNTLHGIEFKIFNWKNGFSQCLSNRILIPFNSLAIHSRYVKNVNKEELNRKGIGLICISDKSFKVLLKPKKSKFTNNHKYELIKQKIC